MEMADSSFCENDLDEEKARRSILVTNVPGNFTYKDVIIHFQKGSNGGGEVDSGMYHDSENRSSVVITFEDPSTVETAIAHRQVLGKTEVTVQRYPVGIRIPEVFSDVDARLNPEILDLLPSMETVLRDLNREHGIRCWKTVHDYIVISGSYKQITSCQKYIRDEIANSKSKGHGRSRPLHGHVAAAGARRDGVHVTPRDQGKSDEIEENYGDKGIDSKTFQSVPIILDFILSVPKYSERIKIIESEFNVKICGVEGGNKVVIKPLPGCTHRNHDDACEEYISLYQDVNDGPMMSKHVVLKPGKDSFYLSAEEALQKVLQKEPVAIQKIEEPDKWLFYGEETNVKSAIKAVCKKLGIEHPFRKTHKVVARHDPEKEEGMSGSGNNHHLTLEDNKAERDAPKESYDDMKRYAYEDHQGNKEKPFEIETKKGFRLTIHQGDITQESVDVIVNSTDESLGFLAGLPAELVRRGGRVIQDEAQTEGKRRKAKPGNIIITGPGKLYCLKVFHVITTRLSRKSKEDCKNFAKEACLKCLKQTNKEKLNSIAFPALGTGQQGMALGLCAAGMINAVEEYMKATDPKKGAVTDIRFVHQDLSAVEVFKAELTKRYGDSIVKPKREDLSTRGTIANPNISPLGKSSGFTAGRKTTKEEEEKDVCPICLEDFQDPKTLSKCNHKFCRLCIELAFQHRKVCPTCGMAYGIQTGNMPRGTMNYSLEPYLRLPGYERYGAIRIDYYFPNGTQGPEHPNPGKWYGGTSRSAYLPDSPEGREVLHLLKKAFDARLTFTIGTSVTTGASDVVTWNDIHHKTSVYGGATSFGYPDPTYLKRVKAELAAKGIS